MKTHETRYERKVLRKNSKLQMNQDPQDKEWHFFFPSRELPSITHSHRDKSIIIVKEEECNEENKRNEKESR